MRYSKRAYTQKLGLVRKFTDEANKLDFPNKIFLSIGVPDLSMEENFKQGIKEAVDMNYTSYTPTAGLDIVKH